MMLKYKWVRQVFVVVNINSETILIYGTFQSIPIESFATRSWPHTVLTGHSPVFARNTNAISDKVTHTHSRSAADRKTTKWHSARYYYGRDSRRSLFLQRRIGGWQIKLATVLTLLRRRKGNWNIKNEMKTEWPCWHSGDDKINGHPRWRLIHRMCVTKGCPHPSVGHILANRLPVRPVRLINCTEGIKYMTGAVHHRSFQLFAIEANTSMNSYVHESMAM